VVINYFNVAGILTFPTKANSPLIINSNAMLSATISLQGFEPISWRSAQIVQSARLIEQEQFAPGNSLYLDRQFSRNFIRENSLRFRARKVAYHPSYYNALRYRRQVTKKMRFPSSVRGHILRMARPAHKPKRLKNDPSVITRLRRWGS
jgi:hypothetical protein